MFSIFNVKKSLTPCNYGFCMASTDNISPFFVCSAFIHSSELRYFSVVPLLIFFFPSRDYNGKFLPLMFLMPFETAAFTFSFVMDSRLRFFRVRLPLTFAGRALHEQRKDGGRHSFIRDPNTAIPSRRVNTCRERSNAFLTFLFSHLDDRDIRRNGSSFGKTLPVI